VQDAASQADVQNTLTPDDLQIEWQLSSAEVTPAE
jgi:hypothetical protein